MKLYEIVAGMEDCFDMETGEILDIEKLDSLQMDFSKKMENILLFAKNEASDAAEIKAEIETLEKRMKVHANKSASLKSYAARVLEGQKFETPKVKASWRTTRNVVEVADESILAPEYLNYGKPRANKTAIKEALLAGVEIPGCQLVDRQSMSIK